ncbi:hypothetical protein G3480_24185 [Thiorhodococcus mannitoliphagus]|uniref:Uncharacterized protein n=1 Tax=Thiorhodococcus mannitoliphagus TaxID=329406 RepID=A0A6P1E736_9GAMM|nr:hypothetical protein [Thiorhodococcus mannitoliphagus]NEX23355.1 hypothetical protein [Thiorhodococcus mannitoliphagus]
MKRFCMALACLFAASAPTIGSAAPTWYVGYSFVYSDARNLCSFMRFQADAFGIEQADVLYKHLEDLMTTSADEGATFAHTLPSEALAKGQTGEQVVADIAAEGLAACTVAEQPVDGMLLASAFPCFYQDQQQMCFRLYVNTGDTDPTAFGIDPGPAELGGSFVLRKTWDASAGLVYAGRVALPFAVQAPLSYAASGLQIFRD